MLTNEVQQKIITGLLKRPENQYCSDCNCKSPCWASLDFGVFVCMNCSGAHRALGPSITRVKSTKLDIWNKDWVDNMKIGNSILNTYWEHSLSSHPSSVYFLHQFRKPNVNSSLNEIKKYVYDKYVKRKFVDPDQDLDPLSKVKKGISLEKPENDNAPAKSNNVIDSNPVKPQIQPLKETPKKHPPHSVKETTLSFSKDDVFKVKKPQEISNNKKAEGDLLDFQPSNNAGQKAVHQQTTQSKNFEFNFNEIQVQKPKQSGPVENRSKQMSFDNFLQNVSNKSEQSHGQIHHPQQPIHGNYFMSPQGFVNTNPNMHYPNHGYSLPAHHVNQPQVTMNINMNMYPNVMNINMGAPQNYHNMGQSLNPVLNPNTQKQFQYNDFFTGNISPPPQSQNITLEVTLNQNTQQKVNKDSKSSWVDDWM